MIQIFYGDVCRILLHLNLQREHTDVSVSLLVVLGGWGTGSLQKRCLHQGKTHARKQISELSRGESNYPWRWILWRKEGACPCPLTNCSSVRYWLFPLIQIEQEGAVTVLVKAYLFWLDSGPHGTCLMEKSLISNSIVNESLKKTPFFSLSMTVFYSYLTLQGNPNRWERYHTRWPREKELSVRKEPVVWQRTKLNHLDSWNIDT